VHIRAGGPRDEEDDEGEPPRRRTARDDLDVVGLERRRIRPAGT
jgi:hypothetical protein